MGLNLTVILVKAIFQNDDRMVDLDVHTCAEGALLELREDVSVQNCPVWMQSEWVKTCFFVFFFCQMHLVRQSGLLTCQGE